MTTTKGTLRSRSVSPKIPCILAHSQSVLNESLGLNRVPFLQVTIRFFGTEDYWFLGTIEVGRSENYIKSLGRWVTRLLGH